MRCCRNYNADKLKFKIVPGRSVTMAMFSDSTRMRHAVSAVVVRLWILRLEMPLWILAMTHHRYQVCHGGLNWGVGICTEERVLKDHPIGYKSVVCQDRWSLVTGSVILKLMSFCRKRVVCQDRWSLIAVVSQDRFHCIIK